MTHNINFTLGETDERLDEATSGKRGTAASNVCGSKAINGMAKWRVCNKGEYGINIWLQEAWEL